MYWFLERDSLAGADCGSFTSCRVYTPLMSPPELTQSMSRVRARTKGNINASHPPAAHLVGVSEESIIRDRHSHRMYVRDQLTLIYATRKYHTGIMCVLKFI